MQCLPSIANRGGDDNSRSIAAAGSSTIQVIKIMQPRPLTNQADKGSAGGLINLDRKFYSLVGATRLNIL